MYMYMNVLVPHVLVQYLERTEIVVWILDKSTHPQTEVATAVMSSQIEEGMNSTLLAAVFDRFICHLCVREKVKSYTQATRLIRRS